METDQTNQISENLSESFIEFSEHIKDLLNSLKDLKSKQNELTAKYAARTDAIIRLIETHFQEEE